MNKDVAIRHARPHEWQIVQALNYALFESDQRHFHDLNMEWTYGPLGENYFRKLASGEYGVCYVAETDGSIIGYLAGAVAVRDPAYTGKRTELENMFVFDEYRSLGIGTRLVAAFFEWSKEQHADMAFVAAFSPNTRAIAFYDKAGFDNRYSEYLMKKID